MKINVIFHVVTHENESVVVANVYTASVKRCWNVKKKGLTFVYESSALFLLSLCRQLYVVFFGDCLTDSGQYAFAL